MLYALLCYNPEEVVYSWSKEEDDAVMARLDVVHQRLAQQNKLGPALRLAFPRLLSLGTSPPVVQYLLRPVSIGEGRCKL